jgi:hypothetical protein
MKTTQPRVSRRRFLIGATAGTAATAVAIVANKEGTEAATRESATQSKKGYQLTEHVQNYYRTAKI